MTKACFKISGEFITEHARTLVREDRWEDALHLLMDCVEGTDYQIAVSILSGEQRFTGLNNLSLEDEDPPVREQTQKDLAYHFCGIVKHCTDYWRPYAYVDNWFEGDLNQHTMTANRYNNYDGPAPTKLSDRFRTWSRARNNYYMTNAQEDLATLAEVNSESVIVLWSKVRVPPPWITIQRDRQPAINEYLQHRWLEHRGAHQFAERNFTEHKETNLSEKAEIAQSQFEQEQEAKYQKDYAAVVAKLSTHNLDTRNGWLSPTGKLIPCYYMEHDFFAMVILSEKYELNSQQAITRGDALIQLGWVKLQDQDWPYNNLVTQQQIDTIWDYSQKHGRKMPEDIQVK